jgi:ribonuclease III
MAVKPNLTLLQKNIDYQFNNLSLLTQALTHRSANHCHNERLEFLGDAILGSVIATVLYQKFPDADEGQLSRLRSFLVKEKALSGLANELNFSQFLILGSGELKSGGFRRDSILSDTFEAVIGAVLLDSDYSTAEIYLLNLYKEKLAKLSLEKAQKDPKTRLQEWLQSKGHQTPDYQVLRSTGKDHAKLYWVSCEIAYQNISLEGHGPSRRKAEQDAACKAIEKIQLDSKVK